MTVADDIGAIVTLLNRIAAEHAETVKIVEADRVKLSFVESANAALQKALDECRGGTPPPPPPPPGSHTIVKGVWAIQQAGSMQELNGYSGQIAKALALSDAVLGLSLRVPWTAVASNFDIYDRAREIAGDKQLSVRFMAGRHTPQAMKGATYTVGGEMVPAPFTPAGAVNTTFEAAYVEAVNRHLEWCYTHDVTLLHLPFHGQDWAELNHGKEVRAAAGYSYDRWLTGHKRLVDGVAGLDRTDVTVEWPMSGYGPLADAAAPALAAHIDSRLGHDGAAAVQVNGWGHSSYAGPNNTDTTGRQWLQFIEACPVPLAVQAIQPFGAGNFPAYTEAQWMQAFVLADQAEARYAEVYLPSFSGAQAAVLRSAAEAWAA